MKHPFRFIAIVCLAQIFAVTGMMYFPALLTDFQVEWSLSNTEAGWINGIYYAGYAVTVPFLVSLTDRVDPRRVYLAASLLGAVSMFGFGLFAEGTWSAGFFRLLGGISLAGTYMPGLRALSDRMAGALQSRAVTFYTAASGVGTAASVFAVGELAAWLDWRWVAVLMGLGPVVAVAIFAIWVPRGTPDRPCAPGRPPIWDFRPAFRNRRAVGYMCAYGVHAWELFGFRNWLVAFLVFSAALQPGGELPIAPHIVATVALLVGLPASVLGNEGSLRWGRRRAITIYMISAGVLGCVIGFTASLPFLVVSLLCMIYGFGVMMESGSITSGLVAAAREGQQGMTMAVHSFFGYGMGFLAPLAFGIVLDVAGGGLLAWGLAFAAMGLVAMTGPVWLRHFGSVEENP
ncbi:MAG: MFS transporter [Proteobacteria bacterium]|nr:MFS transporter [Pseudomonadota bacterium]